MKLAEIPRVAAGSAAGKQISSLEGMAQERMILGRRAADVLGYTGLVADVTGETVLVRPGKLAEALRSIEIEVLDLASVLTYQMEEIARATRAKIEDDNLDDWVSGYFTEAGWTKTELASYRHPVPEFVLDKAIRIKEKVPEVKFHVQHLHDAKADPFLVAHVGKEIYYIEAWDEPRFEGRTRR